MFEQIKPDTTQVFETFLSVQLSERDPRRNQPLIDFIRSQTIDFNATSAFALTKRLTATGTLSDSLGTRFESGCQQLIDLYFDNIQTQYAEVRELAELAPTTRTNEPSRPEATLRLTLALSSRFNGIPAFAHQQTLWRRVRRRKIHCKSASPITSTEYKAASRTSRSGERSDCHHLGCRNQPTIGLG